MGAFDARSVPLILRVGNVNEYTSRLANLWTSRLWLPDQDYARAQDPTAWEKFQRDPKIKMAIQKRLHKVAGSDWGFDPASDSERDKDAADWMTWVFAQSTNLQKGLFHHLAKCVFRGRAHVLTNGLRRSKPFRDGPAVSTWFPLRYRHIDERRVRNVSVWKNMRTGEERKSPPMRTVPIVPGRVSSSQQVNSEPMPGWETRYYKELGDAAQPGLWRRLNDHRWVAEATYDNEESRFGYGRGLMEAFYFYHYVKGTMLRDWTQLSEKLGQGATIVKLDGELPGNSEQTNEERKQAYIDEFQDMQGRNVLVMDKMDEVSWEFPDGTSADFFIKAFEYLDDCVVSLILGGTLPTGGGGPHGSLARAEVEQESEEDIIDFDRWTITAAIQEGPVSAVWDVNRSARVELGLGDAQCPRFRMKRYERSETPQEAATTAKTILDSGVALSKTEYYERVGWRQPADDEETIEGRNLNPEPMGVGAAGAAQQ